MTNTKMTNRKALEYIKANCDLPAEVAEKVDGMILQLEKKSSTERKPTKTQIENEGYKALVLSFVGSTPVTVTDILKGVPEFDGFSNQKITRMVTDLLNAGKLAKTVIKGRSYFSKV